MIEQAFDLGAIVMADLVLSGDNALVIGMAASALSPGLRGKAILFGMVIAAVLRVAFDKPVARMIVVALGHAPVLAAVVEPDHLVTGGEQLLDEVAADEPGSAGDKYLHAFTLPGS